MSGIAATFVNVYCGSPTMFAVSWPAAYVCPALKLHVALTVVGVAESRVTPVMAQRLSRPTPTAPPGSIAA